MRKVEAIGIFAAGLAIGLLINHTFLTSPTAFGQGVDGGSGGSGSNLVGGGCPGDIAPSPNGDGSVGVPDLLALINAWGPCPSPDKDNDGWTVAEGDCNDSDPNVNPAAAELCNGIDDNCDTNVDEGYNVGSVCVVGIGACEAIGVTVCDGNGNTVCNAVPGLPSEEVCGNGIDDDCNGLVDETCNQDLDNDGWTVGEGDCNDADPNVHPAHAEICGNTIDDNCNGNVDEGCP